MGRSTTKTKVWRGEGGGVKDIVRRSRPDSPWPRFNVNISLAF